MKLIFLLTAVTGFALAQPTGLRVTRATHQQIILSYEASAGDECRIEVSESPSYTPVVADLDSTLFGGADRDLSRSDTHVSSSRRTVVVGKRLADVTTDGRLVSRSLQANTPHYIRISQCGGTATTVVATQNIPWGILSDPFQPDPRPGMNGYYGYPTPDYTRENESFIDPLTGALVKRMAAHPPFKTTMDTRNIGTITGPGWTDPTQAKANNDLMPARTASTSILLAANGSVWPNEYSSIHQMQLTIRGRVAGGASGNDAVIEVSLCTANEILSDWQEVQLTNSFANHVIGDMSGPLSEFWFKKDHPVEGWFHSAGGRGFCIRKKTASGHELQISRLSYAATAGIILGNSTTLPQFCAYSTTTDPGQPGKKFLPCYFPDRAGGGSRIYTFETTTGTTTWHGPASLNSTQTGLSGSWTGPATWDRNNPRRFYGYRAQSKELFRCDLKPDANALVTPYTGGTNGSLNIVDRSTCKVMTPMGSGFNLSDQAKQLGHPNWSSFWDANGFGLVSIWPGNYLVFDMKANGQGTGGWVAVYDPSAPAPEGCTNCEGRLIALSSFGVTRAGVRHDHRKGCLIHTTNSTDVPGWVAVGCSRQSTNLVDQTTRSFGGPWALQIQRHSSYGSGSIQPTDTRFQLLPISGSYNWRDLHQSATTEDDEVALEVGDRLIYKGSGNPDTDWLSADEVMEITQIHPDNSITVRRGPALKQSPWLLNSGYTELWTSNTAKTIPGNTYVYLIPKSVSLSWTGNNVNWNFIADPLGLSIVQPAREDNITSGKPFPPKATEPTPVYPVSSGYASPNLHNFNNFGNHGTHSVGLRLQYDDMKAQFWGGDVGFIVQAENPGTMTQVNGPVTQQISISPRFAGVAPGTVPSADSHVKRRQYNVPKGHRNWDHVMDIMPFVTLPQTSGISPVSGTAKVYRFNTSPVLQRKHYGTFAFSGDRVLKDISGDANCATDPGNEHCIDDADLFSYCVALKANECRSGSAGGEVFYNSPVRNTPYCSYRADGSTLFTAAAYPMIDYGGCIQDLGYNLYGVLQTDVSTNDFAGIRNRRITRLFQRPLVQARFAVAHVTPDSDWVLFLGENHGMTSWNATKLPPLPEISSANPLTFDRVGVDLYHPTAAKFRMEFGYLENGRANDYYCTTRQDRCVVDAVSFKAAAPFKWAAETPGFIACAGKRCKAEIPRLPGRVVYSRAVFYDEMNQEIESKVLPPY